MKYIRLCQAEVLNFSLHYSSPERKCDAPDKFLVWSLEGDQGPPLRKWLNKDDIFTLFSPNNGTISFFSVCDTIYDLSYKVSRQICQQKSLDYPRISSGSLLATTNTQNIFFFFFFNTAFSSWAHNCRKIIGIRLNVKWLELRFKKKTCLEWGESKDGLVHDVASVGLGILAGHHGQTPRGGNFLNIAPTKTIWQRVQNIDCLVHEKLNKFTWEGHNTRKMFDCQMPEEINCCCSLTVTVLQTHSRSRHVVRIRLFEDDKVCQL